MICQECKKNNLVSTISIGSSSMTCAGVTEYYDTTGKLKRYDPNFIKTNYCCSNGHSWTLNTSLN